MGPYQLAALPATSPATMATTESKAKAVPNISRRRVRDSSARFSLSLLVKEAEMVLLLVSDDEEIAEEMRTSQFSEEVDIKLDPTAAAALPKNKSIRPSMRLQTKLADPKP